MAKDYFDLSPHQRLKAAARAGRATDDHDDDEIPIPEDDDITCAECGEVIEKKGTCARCRRERKRDSDAVHKEMEETAAMMAPIRKEAEERWLAETAERRARRDKAVDAAVESIMMRSRISESIDAFVAAKRAAGLPVMRADVVEHLESQFPLGGRLRKWFEEHRK